MKGIFIIILLLISVTAFSPLFAQEVFAEDPPASTTDKTANPDNPGSSETTVIGFTGAAILAAINVILTAFVSVGGYLLGWAGSILSIAIDFAMTPFGNLEPMVKGWQITRDVINSFFILALFIIAIATILQLESYAWKSLLPTFIIVALLVNFSFVFTGVIIDFTNIIGKTFIDGTKPVTDNIMQATGLNKIFDIKMPPEATPESDGAAASQQEQYKKKNVSWWSSTWKFLTKGGLLDKNSTIRKGVTFVAAATAEQDIQKLVLLIFRQLLIFIYLLVAIFVFLAAGFFLIVRSVALVILVVLSPVAFFAYILPGTKSRAMQWWNALLSWAFFFPIFSFLIYLSVRYGLQVNKGEFEGSIIDNLALMYNYIAMIIFLAASVLLARQFGVYGAESVIKLGVSARKWATGYAGRMTGVPRLSEKLAESGAAQRFAARFPTLGGATLRTLQKGATLGGREAVIKREVDTAMKLAPRYQATAYLKASAPVRRRLEDQMKAEGMAEIMHYTDDQKTRQKIKDSAFVYQSPDQRKDSQEKLKIAYADREINKQSTGQLVGRFDSSYYSKEEEEKIFDVAKTDKRAKILLRSKRDIAELEQRMLNGIGEKDVREIERTYDEIARNGIEMDGDMLVQKFNKLSKAANQKLYDIIDPGDLREKMAGFADAATLASTPATLTPAQQAALTDVQRKQYEQKQFLNKMESLGTNKRGVEIRKIVGAAGPTYWQELGYGSQQELVEKLTPAEAATMREKDMKEADISQHFDGGQLEAIARSQRVAPETRQRVRDNVIAYSNSQRTDLSNQRTNLGFQLIGGQISQVDHDHEVARIDREMDRFVHIEDYLKKSSAYQ